MTDETPNLDEMISAYIDGEATDTEVALVEASPESVERAERLRAVAGAVAHPVAAPDPIRREAAIAAAVAASVTEPNVTSLATRRPRSARTLQLASIAAVVAMIMSAVPLILLSRSNDNDQASFASEDTATSAESFNGDSVAASDDGDGSTADADNSLAAPEAQTEHAAEEPAEAGGSAAADDSREAADTEAAAADEAVTEGDVTEEAAFDFDPFEVTQFKVDDQTDAEAVGDALLEGLANDLLAEAAGGNNLALLDDPQVFDCVSSLFDPTEVELLGFTVADADGTSVLAIVVANPDGTVFAIVAEAATCSVMAEVSGP